MDASPAPSSLSTPATPATPAARLLRAVVGVSVVLTVLGFARHGFDTLRTNGDVLTWAWALANLAGAMGTLVVGRWLIDACFPLRALRRSTCENPAAAILCSAHALSPAIIAAACWGVGDGQAMLVSAAFSLLGIAAVIAVSAAHRMLTRYRDHEEIAGGNVAAALAGAGLHLGVALVVGSALTGSFLGWSASLTAFSIAAVWVLALWPLREVVLARVVLRMTPAAMDAAVQRDRDVWIGAAEGCAYIIAASLLTKGL